MDEFQKSRITLLDIAADADVSRSTVSLVIRNVPSVAETTRKRVLRSIKKLGYVYHRGAASLRRQHSHAVGLIVSDITNPFFAEIIVAIEERLAEAGFVTLLGNTSEDRSKEERLLRTMQEFPADRRGGFDGVQKLMKGKNPPSAVLCFNDVVALGAMEGLQRLGRKPGIDVGIVGFNNIPDAD